MSQRPQSAHPDNRDADVTALTQSSKFRPQSSFGRSLHDPAKFWDKKMSLSASHFRNTRVQTCSHILKKGNRMVAVQFPLEKTGWKADHSYQNVPKSQEIQSWA